MTDNDSDVKAPTRHFVDWIDSRPRLGWYVAAWAALITVNQFYPFMDRLVP